MSEYLMFAHEIERARLLAPQAGKDHHREEGTSPTGNPPESYGRTRDGADSYLIEDGKIVAQTIHYTMEDERS
jgi:hypothetical protein